jgi:sugar phosphate isomerase/epimerase
MKDMLFSINSWIFGPMPIDEIARRAKSIGVGGLDINGEPDHISVIEVKKALAKNDLVPVCINGNFLGEERAFCHSDPKYRSRGY